MRSTYFVSLVLLAAACGDDTKKEIPDAREFVDAPVMDAPPTVVPCAYTEMNDATNDDFYGTGTAEATAISFGASATAVCGKLNMGHYMAGNMSVDVDSFSFTVPADSRAILHLTAPGAENFESVTVQIYGMTNMISELGQFEGNFATTSAELPAGDYEITVVAFDNADSTAALDYKVLVEVDSATRCPKSTATAFAEAGEGNPATGGGNDVYEVRYTGNTRAFTANGTDAPEDTMFTIQPNMSYRATGEASNFTAAPVSQLDSFQDRDTYLVTMGANTNELTVRLNWSSTAADFDFFVFKEGALNERARGWYGGNMEDEFTTLAVTPGAKYWVFVGADDASTQPATYDVTFCGSSFAP